jgi:site-specific DNA recombinase
VLRQMSAVGYVRVSTEDQVREGVSLEAQRAKLAAYCTLHALTLENCYVDEGISGKRADNRPGLQEAITRACAAKGVLVVYSLSRLARSTKDAIEIAERLDKAGANLVSITERIDTTTSMGKFFFTTVAALAQLERDQISERTSMALAHLKQQNRRASGIVPYGFRINGELIESDPAEQRTLVLIRHMHRNGFSTRRIGRELAKLGMQPRAGVKWHPKVVMDLCRR